MNHRTALGLVLIVMFSIGHASAHDAELWDLKSYELPDGKLDLARLQRDYKIRKTSVSRKSSVQFDAVSTNWRAQAPVVSSPAPAIISKAEISPPIAPPPTTSFTFLLRKDFTDINLFSAPISNQSATGAQFSLTRDLVAHSTTWMADATVAAAYTYFVQDIRNPFIGVTVAPYVTLDRNIYSATPSQNVDEKTFGISGEIGAKSLLFPNKSDYLRISAAAMEDDVKGTTVAHAAVEWLPTYTWAAGTLPGTFMNYNFTPEVEAQFDSTNASGKTILFSNQQELPSTRTAGDALVQSRSARQWCARRLSETLLWNRDVPLVG